MASAATNRDPVGSDATWPNRSGCAHDSKVGQAVTAERHRDRQVQQHLARIVQGTPSSSRPQPIAQRLVKPDSSSSLDSNAPPAELISDSLPGHYSQPSRAPELHRVTVVVKSGAGRGSRLRSVVTDLRLPPGAGYRSLYSVTSWEPSRKDNTRSRQPRMAVVVRQE